MDKLFRIFEITEELASEISAGPKRDHFHDFEELIIISKGRLNHFIDFRADEVNGPFACYISMGKTHRLEPESDLRGWVINYKTEFIPDSKLSFYSNFKDFTNIPLNDEVCVENLLNLCKVINAEYSWDYTDFTTLRHLVNSVISMLDSQMRRNVPADSEVKSTQLTVFNNFLRILEANFRRDEGVSFYADKMNMSERNLNIICKNNFQKSVSEIIEARKLIEARKMLIYSDKSVSEIGFEIGYNEKSYFTRVFRSRLGMTPSSYRDKIRRMIS